MIDAGAVGLRCLVGMRHERCRAASSFTSVIIVAGVAVIAAAIQVPAAAQSVTGSGDIVPALPPPPLPNWDLGGNFLFVGNTGTGALDVEGGAIVKSPLGVIGNKVNSSGEVTVRGSGSQLNTTGLSIGISGKGILSIEDGAKVQSGDVSNLAAFAGSEGKLTVTGDGSSFSTSDQLGVGLAGKGTVIVTNGALLESKTAFVGAVGTGEGLVTVSGANSVWTNTTFVTFGNSGNAKGTLRIEDGGLVQVGGKITVSEPTTGGATGILAIDSKSRLEGSSTYTQGLLGHYVVGVDAGASTAGLIKVTGAANITAGSKLEVVLEGGATPQVGERFLVLDAASIADNAFTLENGGAASAFLAWDDLYDVANGDVYVELAVARALTAAAVTPNQAATAAGAESSAAVIDLFRMLASDAQAQDAFDQTSGEAHASIRSMLISDTSFLRGVVFDRLHMTSAGGGEDMAMVARNDDGRIEPAADITVAERHSGFWLAGFGSWGDFDGDGNAASLDRSLGGSFIGIDTDVDGWRFGALAGYSHASFDVDDRNSSGSVDGYHVGLYGGTTWQSIALRAGASYTWNDIETKRQVTNPAVEELEADYGAHLVQVFGELAYAAQLGGLVLEPFADVAYVNLDTESFEEHGGTLALEAKSDSTDSVSTTLGVRPELGFDLADIDARLSGLIGWRHAFGDVTPDARFAFQGGDTFTIRGVPMARDTAVVEAGFDLRLSDSASLGVAYQGQFGDGVSDNGVSARLGVSW